MKKIFNCLFIIFFLNPVFVGAQVGIGTIDPDPSALLDLVSNNEGLLVPRMTTANRDLIVAPATGLLIYNTSLSSFNYYDSEWKDWKSYSTVEKNYNSNLTGDISTISSTNEVVTGMSIAPPFAGRYKVSFSSYFNNAPLVSNPFSTEDCKNDLLSIYNNIINLPFVSSTHAVLFGNGEVLTSGVYSVGAAATTAGMLYFDGEGNSDAIFVIRVSGAFATGAGAKMVLLNGARAANVFWVIEGSVGIGDSNILKGIVIAHDGAIAMGVGGNLEGRLFSTFGAIHSYSGNAIIPAGKSLINLGVLSSFIIFSSSGAISNDPTSVITGNVGTNSGTITGFGFPGFKGSLLNSGEFITTLSPNNTNALGTFGIYQNGVLITGSNKMLTSNADSTNLTLQAIATILNNQSIDVRWNTDSEKIVMGNRTLTLIKIE